MRFALSAFSCGKPVSLFLKMLYRRLAIGVPRFLL